MGLFLIYILILYVFISIRNLSKRNIENIIITKPKVSVKFENCFNKIRANMAENIGSIVAKTDVLVIPILLETS